MDIIFDLVPEIVLKTTSDLEIILQIISKSIMKIVLEIVVEIVVCGNYFEHRV